MVTHSVHSTLNSIGGIQVLFPLFAQLDLPSSEPSALSASTTTAAAAPSSGDTENEVSPAATEEKSVSTMSIVHGGTKDQSLW